MPLRRSSLSSARQEQYQALAPFEERLKENQLKHWLHVICTPRLTFFSVQRLRGKETINAIGIIPQFTGWLMHDFLSSYLGFANGLHSFCKSHLMRELVFLFEQPRQSWAKDLHQLFPEMLRYVQRQKARDAPPRRAAYQRWQQRYRQILRAGLTIPSWLSFGRGSCLSRTTRPNVTSAS
jgi:hypothetical protein